MCGTTPTDAEVKKNEAHFLANKVPIGNSPLDVSTAATNINVYFHVIQAGTSASQGAVTYVSSSF